MSKINQLIRGMMLRWPTLYSNRFEAFAELMTNSCYEWVDGELTPVFVEEEATPETMIAEYEANLNEAREKAANEKCEVLHDLNRRRVVEAERELLEARHIAENIDVYVSDYTHCSYRDSWAWLHHTDRRGVSEYWSINHKPDNITPEWRDAIYGWLHFLIPSANSLMGMNRPGGFDAIPRYAATFDWLKAKFKEYEPPRDPEQDARMAEMIRRLVDATQEGSA